MRARTDEAGPTDQADPTDQAGPTEATDGTEPTDQAGPTDGAGRPGNPRWPARLGFVLVFVAMLAVAAALRFVDLANNPGGFYGDEASEGLDALKLLHQPGFHPDWLVWFQDDGGREALFAYVVAAAYWLFGEATFVLRGVAAAFGVAGVAAIGLLARRWGNGAAIVAAAWAAGSLWLVAVSRDGMRNTIVPLFGAAALLAILIWAARPTRSRAILAGAVTSLATLYTYQPLKLLPLLIVVWLWWLRRTNRPAYDRLRPGIAAAVAAFLVVGAPMLAVALTEPASYFGRAAATSIGNPDVVSSVPYPIHVLRTVFMFGFFGDQNGRHDVGALPLLPIPLAIVALFGLARLWRERSDPAASLVLLALPIFLLPPLLFPDGYSPHFLRSLGLAAPLGVTIGLGAVEIAKLARDRFGRPAMLGATTLVAATLAVVAVWSGFAYLNRSVAERWDAFSYPASELAAAARNEPNSAVILGGFDRVDVEFLNYHEQTPIIDPSSRLPDGSHYSRVFALRRTDFTQVLGLDAATRAEPVAFDPWGNPSVWAVRP